MNQHYTSAQVVDILRLNIKAAALNKAEKESRVPEADRIKRGKISARAWKTEHLPIIAKEFGSFKPLRRNCVISSYFPKGGVGKTSWSINFARILSLNGIRVLLVGADFQCNLSKSFGITYDGEELPMSLYDAMKGDISLDQIIHSTEIPTLDFIPESPELAILDRAIINEYSREKILDKLLTPIKKDYDVIIIDCPPSWNELVTNALYASDALISPIAADGESFHSLKMFIPHLQEFIEKTESNFSLIKFIPNLVDSRNTFTTGMESKFRQFFGDLFISSKIRDSVIVKEAGFLHKSVLEFKPKSHVAEDMYNASVEIWNNLLNSVED